MLPNFPPWSPDLQVIENVWGKMKEIISKQNISCTHDLWRALVHEWNNVSNDYVAKLYDSIPKKVNNAVVNKGGSTKY